MFPEVKFTEIRGNVDTRLRKIATDRLADATMLAAAGLARLGISEWPGLVFEPQPIDRFVPAVGQAAIAIQCRTDRAKDFARVFDVATARAVAVERALQQALGGGCHTAFGAHVADTQLHLFHENTGWRAFPLDEGDFAAPATTAVRVLKSAGLMQ